MNKQTISIQQKQFGLFDLSLCWLLMLLVLCATSPFAQATANSWDPTNPQPSFASRAFHTATLVGTNKVVIMGGETAGPNFVSTVEIYDGSAGSWTVQSNSGVVTKFHTATLLSTGVHSGKILVVGGCANASCTSVTAVTKLYDPSNDTWTTGPSLTTGRAKHTATVLADGRVLVTGGTNGSNALNTVEIYDPARNAWTTATPNMQFARASHAAVLLTNNKVLVVGDSSAEIFDPNGGSLGNDGSGATGVRLGAWALNPVDISPVRTGYIAPLQAVRLSDGRVAVVGGSVCSGTCTASAAVDVFASDGKTISTTGNIPGGGLDGLTASALPGGRVLIVGGAPVSPAPVGASSASTYLYDPDASNPWLTAASLSARHGHTATFMTSTSSVLVTAGVANDGTGNLSFPADAKKFEFVNKATSVSLSSPPSAIAYGTAVPLTAQVNPVPSSGNVYFKSGDTLLCTATSFDVSGNATCNSNASNPNKLLPDGASTPLVAYYSGDASTVGAQTAVSYINVSAPSGDISSLIFTPSIQLSPNFSPTTYSYNAVIDASVTSLSPDVTTVHSDASSTVRYFLNGTEVNIAQQQFEEANRFAGTRIGPTISLAPGNNVLEIRINAGSVTRSYTINFIRPAPPVSISTNANLSALTLSAGTLSPAFLPSVTSYSTLVPKDVAALTATIATEDSKAVAVLSVSPSLIKVVVTAESGAVKTYQIAVTRAVSSNADLSSMRLSSGRLTPAFSSGVTTYAATVAASDIVLTPSAADGDATISINGATVAKGASSAAIPLSFGANNISVVVTAQDGKTSKTYLVVVDRELSKNADLSGLGLSTATLSPAFAASTTLYTAEVPNAINQISLTPTLADSGASVSVNGAAVQSGKSSEPIPLAVGFNTLTVRVTAADGKSFKTYVVTVTRQIANLTLSGAGAATFDFGSLQVGQTSSLKLTLTNTDKAEIAEIASIAATQPFAAIHNCPAKLPVGASCNITVTFTPLDVDATRLGKLVSSSLIIRSNAAVVGLPLELSGFARLRPLPAIFWDVQGVDQNVLVRSNEADLNAPAGASLSITGGAYSINGGAFTTNPGVLNVGDSVRLQQTSATKPGTVVATFLTVGREVYSFRSTTAGTAFVETSGRMPDQVIVVRQNTDVAGLERKTTLDVEVDLALLFADDLFSQQTFASNAYNVYLMGYVPKGVVALEVPTFLFKNKERAWVGLSSPLAAYLENVALSASSKVTLNVLSDFDFGLLSGVEFYIGVGTSDAEMLAAKRYRAFFKVP